MGSNGAVRSKGWGWICGFSSTQTSLGLFVAPYGVEASQRVGPVSTEQLLRALILESESWQQVGNAESEFYAGWHQVDLLGSHLSNYHNGRRLQPRKGENNPSSNGRSGRHCWCSGYCS